MSDLAERLRASTNYDDRSDAADLIETQAARIAELEAALRVIKRLALTTHQLSKYRSDYLRIIDAALAGGKDE